MDCTTATGCAFKSITCNSCCPTFPLASTWTPYPLLTVIRYRPPPPGPLMSGERTKPTGSDPSAILPSAFSTISPGGSHER